MLYYHGWGFTYTVGAFSLIFGGGVGWGVGRIGEGVGHKLNVDSAPSSEPSSDCLSPSTLPAVALTACPTATQTTLFVSLLAPTMTGLLTGLSQDEPPLLPRNASEGTW